LVKVAKVQWDGKGALGSHDIKAYVFRTFRDYCATPDSIAVGKENAWTRDDFQFDPQ
jgi:hypothetical protein